MINTKNIDISNLEKSFNKSFEKFNSKDYFMIKEDTNRFLKKIPYLLENNLIIKSDIEYFNNLTFEDLYKINLEKFKKSLLDSCVKILNAIVNKNYEYIEKMLHCNNKFFLSVFNDLLEIKLSTNVSIKHFIIELSEIKI